MKCLGWSHSQGQRESGGCQGLGRLGGQDGKLVLNGASFRTSSGDGQQRWLRNSVTVFHASQRIT